MIFFYTRSCAYLQKNMHEGIKYELLTFSDGELLVKAPEESAHKDAWIIASTPPPAENILELLLLLDALQRIDVRLNLLITYFGYARQDHHQPGESLSMAVMFNCLKQYVFQRFIIVGMHSDYNAKNSMYKPYLPLDFFNQPAQEADIIVAPDEGAAPRAQRVAHMVKKPWIKMSKKRSAPDHVEEMVCNDDVADKKVLIVDDMITTACTVIKAARFLKQSGASFITCAAIHGVFSASAVDDVKKSDIDHLYITNTLCQKSSDEKITVFDIGPSLLKIITT